MSGLSMHAAAVLKGLISKSRFNPKKVLDQSWTHTVHRVKSTKGNPSRKEYRNGKDAALPTDP